MSEEEKKSARLSDKAKLSRREFLKDAGICAGCAAIGGAALLSGCAKTTTETVTNTVTGAGKTSTVTAAGTNTTMTITATGAATTKTVTATLPGTTVTATAAAPAASISLVNPEAGYNVEFLFAPRLDTLNGKTVAFHACAPTKWQPHRIFPYVADKLIAKYPTMKVIPLTEFTVGAGIDNPAVAKAAKDKGAHAVINGFAA
jgi:hypothetical protein